METHRVARNAERPDKRPNFRPFRRSSGNSVLETRETAHSRNNCTGRGLVTRQVYNISKHNGRRGTVDIRASWTSLTVHLALSLDHGRTSGILLQVGFRIRSLNTGGLSCYVFDTHKLLCNVLTHVSSSNSVLSQGITSSVYCAMWSIFHAPACTIKYKKNSAYKNYIRGPVYLSWRPRQSNWPRSSILNFTLFSLLSHG